MCRLEGDASVRAAYEERIRALEDAVNARDQAVARLQNAAVAAASEYNAVRAADVSWLWTDSVSSLLVALLEWHIATRSQP